MTIFSKNLNILSCLRTIKSTNSLLKLSLHTTKCIEKLSRFNTKEAVNNHIFLQKLFRWSFSTFVRFPKACFWKHISQVTTQATSFYHYTKFASDKRLSALTMPGSLSFDTKHFSSLFFRFLGRFVSEIFWSKSESYSWILKKLGVTFSLKSLINFGRKFNKSM